MGSQNSPAKLQEIEIASLGSRLDSVEQLLKPLHGVSLLPMIEDMIKMSADSLRSTLSDHHRKSSDDSQRLSEELQGLRENFNGQKTRIDRQVGTMDDLLKRFEAWKTVGNEMGEELKVQTNTVVALGEIVKVHAEVQAVHAKNITVVKDFLYDLRELADDATRNLEADESELDDEPCNEDPQTQEELAKQLTDEYLGEVIRRQAEVNKIQTETLIELGERVELHSKMLEALTQMANDIGTFMKEVREILSDRRTPEPDTRPQQDA